MGEAKRRKLLDPNFGKVSKPSITILDKEKLEYSLAEELFSQIRNQYELSFYVLVEQNEFKGIGIFWCVINQKRKICVGSLMAPHPDCHSKKNEFEKWFQHHRQEVNFKVSSHAKAIIEKHQIILIKE